MISVVIAVDFDGTLVENKFPNIGAPRQKIVDAVKFAKEQGHTLLLWTCRAGVELDAAVNFCRDVLQIEFDKINSDSDVFLEMYSSRPRKIGADLYIDDKAITPEDFVKIMES